VRALGAQAATNALSVVGGAFALGLLGGLLLPISNIEREHVGPLRDRLVEKAQDAAEDAIEHGKQVVQETVDAAMSSAREHASQAGVA
jgi:hypothetical protein